MAHQRDVVAINLVQRLALLDDDTTVPITTLLDADGEKTEDEEEAVRFVAGAGKTWFQGPVDGFGPTERH